MAHIKAGGTRTSQGGNVVGKRRGLKVSGGQTVNAGQILVVQLGNRYYPGENVKQCSNFTLISKVRGKVTFNNVRRSRGLRKYINIEPIQTDEKGL